MHGLRKKLASRRPVAWAVAGLLSALASLPAAAQSSTADSTSAIPSANEWSYELTPYLWLAGVRTDYKLGPLPGNSLSVSSGQILKNLDFAAMGAFEAHKGPWGGFLDAIYVDMGVDNSFAGGLLGGYDVKIKEQIYTLGGTYRLLDSSTKVDLLAGGRYINIGSSLYIPPSLRGLGSYRQDTSAGWAGVVGLRAIVPVADRWSLMGYVDGGGGSNFNTWQVMAGAIYQYSPSTSIKFGYRLMDIKPDDSVIDKLQTGGVYAGLGFKF